MGNKENQKKEKNILVGVRLPVNIRNMMEKHCASCGIPINFFIKKAVIEKLAEELEGEENSSIFSECFKKAEFISEESMEEYCVKRGIDLNVV